MGNYNPLYKRRSLKQIKANVQDISEQPVFVVKCSKCQQILSERGCQIRLASNLKTSGYSTDVQPIAVQEAKQVDKCKECFCLVTKTFCKKCHNFCAIHSIYLCEFCKKEPTNGHKWLFIHDVSGQKTLTKWSKLEPLPIVKKSFQELLLIVGISQETLDIFKKEKITSLEQLQDISNDLLKMAGVCLGDIGKLRQFK